jgi:hypothetical protein
MDIPLVFHYIFVTTYVVRLKLFRLKVEGVRSARLPYFGGNNRFLHQTWLQNAPYSRFFLTVFSLQPIHLSSYISSRFDEVVKSRKIPFF